MVHDANGNNIEAFKAIEEITRSLNRRFPDGNEIFQRISRLSEETGELAKAVNHREGMGIKNQKYGESADHELVSETLDVIGAALDIVLHYDLLDEFRDVLEARYRDHEANNFYKSTE